MQEMRHMSPKKTQRTKEYLERDAELQAKAKYTLKKLENGEIDPSDKTLLFESRFESGNLYLAQKVNEFEYNLLMQNDINTSGHTQWFYFQVKNTRKNMICTFNILNFTKIDSLFNFGMKVSIYSQKKSECVKTPVGWHKGGERISYYSNGIRKDQWYNGKTYYSLTFDYKFSHDDDVVYFAYAFPYTH